MDQKGELIEAELLVLKVDTKASLHFKTNAGSFSERVTDLQCYTQNIDGICNLLVDVLLHQLLTHPQTQAAHSDAPEPNELLISHSRITWDVTFVKCRQTLKDLTFMMCSPYSDFHLNMN